jgi:hypothetical protein
VVRAGVVGDRRSSMYGIAGWANTPGLITFNGCSLEALDAHERQRERVARANRKPRNSGGMRDQRNKDRRKPKYKQVMYDA